MKGFLLLSVLIITLISANIELDIYVPALPQMLEYFSTTSGNLQWILSINFIGVSIGSLVYGPLSDRFGRKRVIMIGLAIFVLGSIGCVISNTLPELIAWRFVQGLGSSAPVVIGFAAIAELYEEKKAAQLISISNSVITASMAAAPVIGNYLTIMFHWRANFIFVLIFALFSFIVMQLIFIEPKKHLFPVKLSLQTVFNDYAVLIRDKRFMFLGIIPCLMYASLIVYIANLSLLFVNYFGVSQNEVGYYQSTIMLTFLILSFSAALILTKLSIHSAQKVGMLVVLISSIFLLLIYFISPQNPVIITLIMVFYATGTAIALGPYISEALNAYPTLRGTSSALLGAIRLALSSFVITIAGFFFNGTLLPIACIILALSIIGLIMYSSLLNLD